MTGCVSSPTPKPEKLTVGSLFSGIGGLDLGLERAGMEVRWQSEINPYCTRVLAKRWPAVPNLGEITQIGWSTVEHVDLICGGYPCPAFSQAARGRNTAPDLWPYMRTAIAALRPRWVLLENVAAHLGRGFPAVLADLDALGFDAEWSTVTACSLGAPHRRARSWPTPTETVNHLSPSMQKWPGHRRMLEMVGSGPLHPHAWEWLMGFPIGWSDCEL